MKRGRAARWLADQQTPLFIDNIIADDWDIVTAGRDQDLEDEVRTVQEAEFGRRQIEIPHPAEAIAHHGDCLVALGLIAEPPIADRPVVVQPQILAVGAPDARALQRGEHLGQSRHITTGKDILPDERRRRAGR